MCWRRASPTWGGTMNGTAALMGQVALVTGASRGLGGRRRWCRGGRAQASPCSRAAGLTSRPWRTRLRARVGDALPVACDLADVGSLERAVERVRRELGPVRVLVNAAGTDVPGPVSELSVDAWDRVMAVNLRAVFVLSRLLVPDIG